MGNISTDTNLSQGLFHALDVYDPEFDWWARKKAANRLAYIYNLAGEPKVARRVGMCSGRLTWGVKLERPTTADEPYRLPGDGRQYKLLGALHCDVRLCPICIARRAQRNAVLLSECLWEAEKRAQARGGVRWVFLTLTMRNCCGSELSAAISALTAAWNRLRRRFDRRFAPYMGWMRAVEVTRNRVSGEYHPHIHAIVGMPGNYGSRNADGDYISIDELRDMWQQCLGVDYLPQVRLQLARDKSGVAVGSGAAREAAKYAVKSGDYIADGLDNRDAARIVKEYHKGLRNKRLLAWGGELGTIAAELGASTMDIDKLENSSGRVREDVWDLVETWSWSVAAGDYILADVQVRDDDGVEGRYIVDERRSIQTD